VTAMLPRHIYLNHFLRAAGGTQSDDRMVGFGAPFLNSESYLFSISVGFG
jgi:hypothetical protein